MNRASTYLNQQVSIAPLIIFRVLFGFIMLVSIIRFVANGWVHDQFVEPEFFFSFYGFEWVKPLGETGMYILFALMALSALGVMLGALYKFSSSLFFLTFTYVELIDKTNYLNHYYFVSVVAFILIFLPANRRFSIDNFLKLVKPVSHIPRWCIFVLQAQLTIVYFYAGVAKLNHDWMVEALPLRIWLPPYSYIPVVGFLFEKLWVAYAFSWFGALYDLTIAFFLFNSTTRRIAYLFVVAFHSITWLLFPIGMFPFIMILTTLIFFSAEFHERILSGLSSILKVSPRLGDSSFTPNYFSYVLALVLIVQVLMPWRYLFYPGNVFWTEEGYRFSWRVMLMEKVGYVIFHVKDTDKEKTWEAYANDHLTPNQEKMMSTQPDMILQYAHFLKDKYENQGIKNVQIRAEAYVTLNGRGSRMFLDPTKDLTKEEESLLHKNWILRVSNDNLAQD